MFTPNKRKQGRGVDRAARKFQILTLLYDLRKDKTTQARQLNMNLTSEAFEMTVYDIGRRIGVTPSQHLRGLVMELVREGVVVMQERPHRKNVNKQVFRVNAKARWHKQYLPLFDAYEGGAS